MVIIITIVAVKLTKRDTYFKCYQGQPARDTLTIGRSVPRSPTSDGTVWFYLFRADHNAPSAGRLFEWAKETTFCWRTKDARLLPLLI